MVCNRERRNVNCALRAWNQTGCCNSVCERNSYNIHDRAVSACTCCDIRILLDSMHMDEHECACSVRVILSHSCTCYAHCFFEHADASNLDTATRASQTS